MIDEEMELPPETPVQKFTRVFGLLLRDDTRVRLTELELTAVLLIACDAIQQIKNEGTALNQVSSSFGSTETNKTQIKLRALELAIDHCDKEGLNSVDSKIRVAKQFEQYILDSN